MQLDGEADDDWLPLELLGEAEAVFLEPLTAAASSAKYEEIGTGVSVSLKEV